MLLMDLSPAKRRRLKLLLLRRRLRAMQALEAQR